MDIKIIFAIIAVIIGLAAFLPYLRDVLTRKTQPHQFTWLIWAITQGTATAALWYGGGGFGAIVLTIGTSQIILLLLLSLRNGSQDITRNDKIVLALALFAIFIWWQLNNALIAIFLITAIDLFGYIPTFRKSYLKPWSETASSWAGFAISALFAILALESYNLLTLTYILTISTANIVLLSFLLIRRRVIATQNHVDHSAEDGRR